jgi:hypothetical protein
MHAAIPEICFDYEPRFTDMDDTYKIGYNLSLQSNMPKAPG